MSLMHGRGAFSASETGLLGYSVGPPRSETHLTWRDRGSSEIQAIGEPDSYFDLALSPDDSRVAVSSEALDGNIDLWIIDPARGGNKERLTTDEAFEFHPAWSPDGREIAFTSNRNGLNNVFRRAADGSGTDALVSSVNTSAQPVWLPDGKRVLYMVRGPDGLWLQSIEEQGEATVLVETAPFGAWNPTFSPGGDWLVYTSDRTGRFEIFARRFPSGRPEHKISVHGGKIPRWRSDRELFFLALDGTMMSVRVDPARNPPFAIPQPLFQTGLATTPVWNRPYEVALNGQRFLIPVSREATMSRTITIVTNWTAGLPD